MVIIFTNLALCERCLKFPFSIDNKQLRCPCSESGVSGHRSNNTIVLWHDSVVCKECKNLFPYSHTDKELICPKCGTRNYPKTDENKLVEHHIKYKEIHGVDETVWITEREHSEIPCNYERLGKATDGISLKEMKRITTNAYKRTRKARERVNRNRIEFSMKVGDNVAVVEKISYYPTTGNIGVSSWFHAGKDTQLPKIDVKNENYFRYIDERKEIKRKRFFQFFKSFPQLYSQHLKNCLEDDTLPRLSPEEDAYIKNKIEREENSRKYLKIRTRKQRNS